MYLPSDELGVEKKVRGYPVGWGGGKGELSGHQPSSQNSTGVSAHRGEWDGPLCAQSSLARAPLNPPTPRLDANAGIVPATLCLPCRSVPAPGSFPCPILTMLSLSRCNCLSLPLTTCAL